MDEYYLISNISDSLKIFFMLFNMLYRKEGRKKGRKEGKKEENVFLTTHSTHFFYLQLSGIGGLYETKYRSNFPKIISYIIQY